jgi:hypothetical protein
MQVKSLILSAGILTATMGFAMTAGADHHAETAMDPESLETYVGYVEYVWLNQGENYSPEGFSDFAGTWAAELSAMNESKSSFSYTPKDQNENYDLLMRNHYSSKAARMNAWQEYESAGVADKLQAAHPEMVFRVKDAPGGGVFGFYQFQPLELPKSAVIVSANPDQVPHMAVASFCTFNEDMGFADLSTVIEAAYMPWLAGLEQDGGYDFTIEIPDFETDRYSFLWLNRHQTAETAAAGQAAFRETGADVAAAFDRVFTCTQQAFIDGRGLHLSES